ncbi:MAG: hypothetical protein AB1779_10900, partial [Candidatus Thermoplasmatota archaeon]
IYEGEYKIYNGVIGMILLDRILTALVVGLSPGGSLMCGLFSFGMSSADRKAGIFFILGRVVGTVIIGAAISIIGYGLYTSKGAVQIIDLVFGVLSIGFGIAMLFGEKIKNLFIHGEKDKCLHKGQRRCKRLHNAKIPEKKTIFGLGFGLVRGATPCLKIIILFPLLITMDIFNGFLMVLIFALSSSIYAVLGFLSADIFKRIIKRERAMVYVGAVILILVGVYYIINYYLTTTTNWKCIKREET